MAKGGFCFSKITDNMEYGRSERGMEYQGFKKFKFAMSAHFYGT
jgi:hypothetical protein